MQMNQPHSWWSHLLGWIQEDFSCFDIGLYAWGLFQECVSSSLSQWHTFNYLTFLQQPIPWTHSNERMRREVASGWGFDKPVPSLDKNFNLTYKTIWNSSYLIQKRKNNHSVYTHWKTMKLAETKTQARMSRKLDTWNKNGAVNKQFYACIPPIIWLYLIYHFNHKN